MFIQRGTLTMICDCCTSNDALGESHTHCGIKTFILSYPSSASWAFTSPTTYWEPSNKSLLGHPHLYALRSDLSPKG